MTETILPYMSEHCPARPIEVFPADGLIPEQHLPDACMSCIYRALNDPTTKKDIVDTYEKGLALAREHVGDANAEIPEEEFNKWRAIALSAPQTGIARQAIDEYGFDFGLRGGDGQSYEPGSEAQVVTVTFNCYEEKRTERIESV